MADKNIKDEAGPSLSDCSKVCLMSTTEKAFRDCVNGARLLSDLKKGIYDVKVAGGVSELDRLEALLGFMMQADDILKKMCDSIGEAIHAVNKAEREKIFQVNQD